jgi:ApbE superfamily uncharacterized protein (UPF0280 family)
MTDAASSPQPRTYRTRMARRGLVAFRVAVRETDLMVLARQDLSQEVRRLVVRERQQLESYIDLHPDFLTALTPWPEDPYAPPLVRDMIHAGQVAVVGPMAAVAGAIAQRVAQGLQTLTDEIIVENGGDIFIQVHQPATVAVYAGKSPLSGRLGLKVDPAWGPLGVCTSSGTVGHSLSLGRADAACVLAPDAALADACATALGNRVPEPQAIPAALEWIATIPGVWGALVVAGEKLGAWGRLELVLL